ncbi:hypothetical protein BDW66DRAFT_136606 [Aspergillus desertorum]
MSVFAHQPWDLVFRKAAPTDAPPSWQWAIQAEVLHGESVQLFLWPHFWRTAEQAEWRHNPFAQPRFIERVEELGPLEWKEELYNRFTKILKS